MVKHKVLSTKKLSPAHARELKEHDIQITEKEFISIKKTWSASLTSFKNFEYLVFTSANAVAAISNENFSQRLFPWKIFCLSGKTKQSILDWGVPAGNIIGEGDNAEMLAEKIINRGVKEIVFFCGNIRRYELPSALIEKGIKVHEVIVYETEENHLKIQDDYDMILFFSPSAVESFFALNQLDPATVCFAIGKTTANALRSHTRNNIITIESPSEERMIKEVIQYLTDHRHQAGI